MRGLHHFSIVSQLEGPTSALSRLLAKQMGLTRHPTAAGRATGECSQLATKLRNTLARTRGAAATTRASTPGLKSLINSLENT